MSEMDSDGVLRSGEVMPAERGFAAEDIAPSGMSEKREAAVRRDVEAGRVRIFSGEMVLAEMRCGGEDGLMDRITDDLLANCTHSQIAESLGLRTGEMCRWIFATPERVAAYRGMLRIKADMLIHEGFNVIKKVNTEGDNAGAKVQHAKLETDYIRFAASKWDRPYYGEDKGAVNVGVGVKFVINADDVGML